MPASFFCSQSYNLFTHSPLHDSSIQNRKLPKKYIFQFVQVRPTFFALTQTENMLTREQIEEIHTERREMGIPTKRTLRRSKAHRPARWFAGSSPNRHLPAAHGQKRPRTATHPSREHGHLGRTLPLYS